MTRTLPASDLSPKMKAMLMDWRIRYRSVDNRTAQALSSRGLVKWAPPVWGDVQGHWQLTDKGNAARKSLSESGELP